MLSTHAWDASVFSFLLFLYGSQPVGAVIAPELHRQGTDFDIFLRLNAVEDVKPVSGALPITARESPPFP